MIWTRRRPLPGLCAAFADAYGRLDESRATSAFRSVIKAVPRSTSDELSAGLLELIPLLEHVQLGNGKLPADLVAGIIEEGADPLPVLDVLVARIVDGFDQALRFPAMAERIGGTFAPPTNSADADALRSRLVAAESAIGLDIDEAMVITQAWFSIDDWIPALLMPLQQKRARLALPDRARLTAATQAMDEHASNATWLLGLLMVLDDEPVVVVDRSSGRAYAITISGIGDNFQLHTLLAATLIGDPDAGLVAGERPHPAWIAAASTGDDLQPRGGIRGQFNLVDATGGWIWNEGRPVDIPAVHGHRVVVLDPPPYERQWNPGRVYPLMVPEVRLDRVLSPEEAADWVRRIAPPTVPDR